MLVPILPSKLVQEPSLKEHINFQSIKIDLITFEISSQTEVINSTGCHREQLSGNQNMLHKTKIQLYILPQSCDP